MPVAHDLGKYFVAHELHKESALPKPNLAFTIIHEKNLISVLDQTLTAVSKIIVVKAQQQGNQVSGVS